MGDAERDIAPVDVLAEEARRRAQEDQVGEAAMEIARIISGKGYAVEVLAPHLAFLPGKDEQMAVRLRWIAPGMPQGSEGVVIQEMIPKMLEQAKNLPSIVAAGLLTPLPPRRGNRPRGFA